MSEIKLDAIDMRILAAVEKHGRMSKTVLLKKLIFQQLHAGQDLTRLEKAGIIKGYHAEIAIELIRKDDYSNFGGLFKAS